MSLIQEALRRQQEEQQGHQEPAAPPPVQQPSTVKTQPKVIRKLSPDQAQEMPPAGAGPSAMPPPIPQAPAPEAVSEDMPPPLPYEAAPGIGAPEAGTKGGSRKLIMFAGIGIAAVVVLGLGAWGVMFGLQKFTTTPQTPAATTEDSSARPATTPTTGTKGSDTQPATTVQTPSSTSSTDGTKTVSSITAPTIPQPVEPPKPVVVAPPPPPPKEPVIWPVLVVNGVVGRGKQGSVKINNEILGVGDTLGDVRILSIENQGVVLEYKGETKVVRAGGSTQ